MVNVYSKAQKSTISVGRFIGKIEKEDGPTVIIFAGIHGNESAGVFALKNVFDRIDLALIKGSFYGICGNLKALSKDQRFIVEDLNRKWTDGQLETIKQKTVLNNEEQEQYELHQIIKHIIAREKPPYYFIDLHTTSSRSAPFITINDAIINRKFSMGFPVPIVLGIEEYLEGPLLSYINTKGYVSLGFESGKHDDPIAYSNAEAFVDLVLVKTGLLTKEDYKVFDIQYQILKDQARNLEDVFEVIHLYRINSGDQFAMRNDFESFQRIEKGDVIAQNNEMIIKSPRSARIFMPLYQKMGNEGFFIIKRIAPFFLSLSELLRNVKADGLFVLFPGVSWQNKKKGILRVNLKVARFMAKPLFHLLGYRSKRVDETHLILNNRERVANKDMYKNLSWYQNANRK